MKLYGTPISPFTRKAMIIAHELGLKLDVLPRPDDAEAFRRINPLGKIPALVLDDGSALFDSPATERHAMREPGSSANTSESQISVWASDFP